LASGRTFYAHAGVLGFGIGLVLDASELCEGWDGTVNPTVDDEPPFAPEERREIAEAMVTRWVAWGGR